MKALNPKRKSSIFVISGPSGSGKTELIKKILEKDAFKDTLIKPISFTTRSPRAHEHKGIDYYFISSKEFNARKKKKEFLESEKIFGNYYATSKKEIKKVLKHHLDVLFCIDVKGAHSVKKAFPKQTILIFILPPEFRVLHQRLSWRGTEKNKDLAMRLERAKEEIRQAEFYDYAVVNDDFSQALRALKAIILAERASMFKGK